MIIILLLNEEIALNNLYKGCTKVKEKLSRIKDENKILIMLAFYSTAMGLWRNFRQLWLQGNGLDVNRN